MVMKNDGSFSENFTINSPIAISLGSYMDKAAGRRACTGKKSLRMSRSCLGDVSVMSRSCLGVVLVMSRWCLGLVSVFFG